MMTTENKSFQHNVLLNLTIADKKVQQELFDKAETLKKINGVTDLSYGINETPEAERAKGYNFGLSVQFKDFKSLLDYQNDPLHVEFKNFIKPLMNDESIVMDYPLQ
ncbi:MAG: Dabb family protein [Micrococcaceae bacterium]